MTVFFILGMMVVGSAIAGEGGYYKAEKSMQGMDAMQVTSSNAHKIIGLRVTNNQGEDLGWVNNLIFSRGGDLSYLIVSDGGVQSSDALDGDAGNLTVIPIDGDIRDGFHVSRTAVTIPVTLSKFSTAPNFTQNQLEDLKSGNWERKANAYFE